MEFCCPPGNSCHDSDRTCNKVNASQPTPAVRPHPALWRFEAAAEPVLHDVYCADGSRCPDGSTCCPAQSGYGCCPITNAICCSDLVHCCPSGYYCNITAGGCTPSSAASQALLAFGFHLPLPFQETRKGAHHP
jgi:hypothetical protein